MEQGFQKNKLIVEKTYQALMRRFLPTLILVCIAVIGFAQSPQMINYQGVARDVAGNVLANQAIGIRIDLRQSTSTGIIVYEETHSLTTNQFGLFNLKIGTGAVVIGNMSGIDWPNGPYFMEVGMDASGGTNYLPMGVAQMLSVPYALYAETAGNSGATGATGPTGSAGNDGSNGATGPTGPTGPQGIQGATGAQGLTGSIGPTGDAGADGADGTDGATGSTGPAGADGSSVVIQGSVANSSNLPGSGNTSGDGYITTDTGHLWVWDGNDWVDAGLIQGPAGSTGPQGAQGIAGANGLDGADGSDGVTGPTGPQGAQGIVGNDGVDGATGPTGATGADGSDGATGPAGATGTNGSDGATGPTGPQGVTGLNGADGSDGVTGPTGPQGAQGIVGNDGVDGATGPTGATGADGSIGATGPTGAAGTNGSDGATGPTGQTGADGSSVVIQGSVANSGSLPGSGNSVGDGYITSDTGHLWVWDGGSWIDAGLIQGPAGPTGPQGIQGIAGSNGLDGATGPTGATGLNGINGSDGATGPTGATGADGTTGPQGNAGSDGSNGATGATGAQGSQGIAGSNGADGATGPTGAQGPTGATGPAASGNTLNEAYDQGGSGAGRVITADNGAVRINGEDGFIVTGSYGSGDLIEVSGAGERMFFSPQKSAFRAGSVDGTQWDYSNIGNHSTAIGTNTIASGDNAIALGESNTASGTNTTVMGYNSDATNSFATAFGWDNEASGNSATVFGQHNTASGTASMSAGGYTVAESAYETVLGRFDSGYTPNSATSWDTADRLFVVGNGTGFGTRSDAMVILKNGNIGIGTSTPTELLHLAGTSGIDGIKFPDETVQTTAFSVDSVWSLHGQSLLPTDAFLGTLDGRDIPFRTNNTEVMRITNGGGLLLNSTVTGTVNTSGAGRKLVWDAQKVAFRVGSVSGTQWDASNRGAGSIAMGIDPTASGENSVAIGFANEATGLRSTSIGSSSSATGNYALAVGVTDTASGLNSTALGQLNSATAHQATAMGYGNTASDSSAVVVGHGASATAVSARAFGLNAAATGKNSTALGGNVLASGEKSMAIGDHVKATAEGSIIIGNGLVQESTPSAIYNTNDSANTFMLTMGRYLNATPEIFAVHDPTGQYKSKVGVGRIPSTNLDVNGSLRANFIILDSPSGGGVAGDIIQSNGNGSMGWVNLGTAGFWNTSGANDFGGTTDPHYIGTVTGQVGDLGFKINSTEVARFTDGGTFLTSGDNDGTVPTGIASGPHMLWSPHKRAFRTVDAVSSAWAASNIGTFSFAHGSNAQASGGNAVAMGLNASASGDASFAFGGTATGEGSTALGVSTVTGNYGFAIGLGNTATTGFAIGNNLVAGSGMAIGSGFTSNATAIVQIGVTSPTLSVGNKKLGINNSNPGLALSVHAPNSWDVAEFVGDVGHSRVAIKTGTSGLLALQFGDTIDDDIWSLWTTTGGDGDPDAFMLSNSNMTNWHPMTIGPIGGATFWSQATLPALGISSSHKQGATERSLYNEFRTGSETWFGTEGDKLVISTDMENDSPDLSINSNGNVGLGVLNSAVKLHVNGNALIGDGTTWNTAADDSKINFGDGDYVYVGEVGDDDVLVLKASAVYVNSSLTGFGLNNPNYRVDLPNTSSILGQGRANAWVTYSSRRWKENVQPIKDALEKVNAIQGVEFDWKKENGGAHDLGFIAEEIGKVLPEIVTYEANGIEAAAVNYDGVVPLLVEAIKELKDRVEALEAENTRLRKK